MYFSNNTRKYPPSLTTFLSGYPMQCLLGKFALSLRRILEEFPLQFPVYSKFPYLTGPKSTLSILFFLWNYPKLGNGMILKWPFEETPFRPPQFYQSAFVIKALAIDRFRLQRIFLLFCHHILVPVRETARSLVDFQECISLNDCCRCW